MSLEFVGRSRELATLNEQYAHGHSFVVLYGRRRVGKTRLVKEFVADKKALYFLASQEQESLSLRNFANSVAAFTGSSVIAEGAFSDWRPLFQACADACQDEPGVIVIDEFPYLVQANDAFPSIMQYVWDEILLRSNVMLVLCGSSVGMMKRSTLEYGSPLYGRRSAQIKLKPLAFSEMRQAFPRLSYDAALDLYAVSGGVPKYLELFDPAEDLEDLLIKHAFATTGFLYEEPQFLLGQETNRQITYLSVLEAIARGNRKISEMSTYLGRKSGDLTPYLKTLIELGFVERRVPFCEKYPERSKNGLYYLADSFLQFWFSYVHPFSGELEMGNVRPSLEAWGRTFRKELVAFVFERVCSQELASLCAAGTLPFAPSRISGYWSRDGRIELDVCALDNLNGRTLLGECKCHERRAFSLAEYERAKAKASSIPNPFERQPQMILFSKTGFEPDLLKAADDESVVLIDRGEVVHQ